MKKRNLCGKYNRPLCWFTRSLTHPDRYRETELGNFFSDVLQNSLEVDLAMVGSGSIRKTYAEAVITYAELKEVFPYDDKIYRLKVTGRQFKKMYRYTLRDEMFEGNHTEFYQYSQGICVVYNKNKKDFIRFDFNGSPIDEERLYTLAMQGFHFQNFDSCFGFPLDEVLKNSQAKILATSVLDVLVEHLPCIHLLEKNVEGRLEIEGA